MKTLMKAGRANPTISKTKQRRPPNSAMDHLAYRDVKSDVAGIVHASSLRRKALVAGVNPFGGRLYRCGPCPRMPQGGERKRDRWMRWKTANVSSPVAPSSLPQIVEVVLRGGLHAVGHSPSYQSPKSSNLLHLSFDSQAVSADRLRHPRDSAQHMFGPGMREQQSRSW